MQWPATAAPRDRGDVPAAGFFAGWTAGFQELRYLLVVCAPLSLACGYLLDRAWGRTWARPLILPALLGAAILALGVVGFHIRHEGPIGAVFGLDSPDDYLRPNAAYRAMAFLGPQLQPGDTTLFIAEAQLLYFPPDRAARTDHLIVNLLALTEAHPEPADALAALRADGVDYVLINEGGIRFWRRFDADDRLDRGMRAFARLTPHLQLVYRAGAGLRTDVAIYRVPAPDDDPRADR